MPIVVPYVPEYITVHLGAPDSAAENVTVSFVDYIKNVASSEIFPTWSEAALLANIYAQISYALNRVYVEFYRSQGYDFDITNSTAFDQSFTPGRNIFENIDRLVDEIFNDYIRRIGTLEPLAAKYCNGTTVTCEGLSQWGSEDLARQGYNSINILKYYYGDDIEIVVEAPIMGITSSYPGSPLRRTDRGPEVIVIQRSLNRISQAYPLIPKIPNVNGEFDEATENAVRTFQEIFNLSVDGIVGKATWYKLVFLYVGIQRLSELDSEGQRFFSLSLEYPQAVSEGDRGEDVYIVQYFLSVLAEFYSNLPFISIDGIFGPRTREAVSEFQRNNGLPQTGVVDAVTYDEMYKQFIGIVNTVAAQNSEARISASPFPGVVLRLGAQGESVSILQQYLNTISLTDPSISRVNVSGVFDQATMLAVMQYQAKYNLTRTGEVDQQTWNSIVNTYKDIVATTNTAPRQFPGETLKSGSSD